MKRISIALGVLILAFSVDAALHTFKPLGGSFFIVADTIVLILSLLAVISGLYAYRMHGFKSIQGKALLFITLGVFFWFLGELTWGIYEVVLGIETPVASIADVFWIIGYPFFLAGFYHVWKISSTPTDKKKLTLSAIVTILILSSLTYSAIPALIDVEMSFAEKASTAGYVIGDMLVLIALTVSITHLLGSRFAKPWSIIFLATLMATIADIYYMNFLEIYETGNLIDLLWDLDYMLLAFGFFYYRETVKGLLTIHKHKKSIKK